MISLDMGSWTGADLTIERTASATPNTWAFATQVGGDVASARTVTADLLSWLNDASREWFGTSVWSMAYSEGADDGVAVTFTPDAGTFDVTPTAAFEAATGIASDTAASSFATDSADHLTGTLWTYSGSSVEQGKSVLEVSNWIRMSRGSGAQSPAWGWTPGPQGTALRAPRVEFVLDEAANDLWAGRLATAAAPRRAHVYQDHESAWLQVALGPVASEKITRDLWRWSVEAYG